MSIHLKYQGREFQKNRDETVYKQTFVGTQSEIDTKLATYTIGALYSGKGYVESFIKKQGEGTFWELEVQYKTLHKTDTANDDGNTIVGKKSASLSVRNIQMPLQKKSNYRKCWNHYLVADKSNATTPGFWSTANYSNSKDETTENGTKYSWIKNISEMRIQPDSTGKRQYELKNPTKPGTEYFDVACFVITITSKYNSATAAGNAVSKNINKIVAPSQTFGLSGGNWKMDQANIQYDSKYWIVTEVYTKSGDSNGWDTDLYQTSN